MRRIVGLLSSLALVAMAQESLRTRLGADNYLAHLNGELRFGSIKSSGSDTTFALGGHLHFDTPEYHGMGAGLSFYGVTDLGLAPDAPNEEFFGSKGHGGIFVSQAFVEYRYKDFRLNGGRLSLDTPHADSDDIRMVPNFFEGVLAKYDGDVHVTLAHVTKMAGWESGGDIYRFKPLYEVVGRQKQNGMTLAGLEDEEYALWLYRIDEIANIAYALGSWQWQDITFSCQLDIANDTGKALAGPIQSRTAGVLLEYSKNDLAWSVACNKEFGDTGSMWSFGGGPFFTSMEDLTIDALEASDALAYTIGVEYDFGQMSVGGMYGDFTSDPVEAKEADLYASLELGQKMEAQLLYATVDNTKGYEDKDIFRILLNYSF